MEIRELPVVPVLCEGRAIVDAGESRPLLVLERLCQLAVAADEASHAVQLRALAGFEAFDHVFSAVIADRLCVEAHDLRQAPGDALERCPAIQLHGARQPVLLRRAAAVAAAFGAPEV